MNFINRLNEIYNSTFVHLAFEEKFFGITEIIREASNKIFSSVLPDVFFYSVHKVKDFPVLNDLISGTLGTVTGTYMMYTSYKTGKIQQKEKSSNAALRRTCALIGAVTAAYGIYTLTSLLAKLLSTYENTDVSISMNTMHPLIYYNGLSNFGEASKQELSSEVLDNKVNAILETFLSCPDAKAIYDKMVREEGPISIRLEDPSLDESIAMSHGYWNTNLREIVIDRTQTHLHFHILIYEMINADQNQKYLNIFNEASEGHLNALEYAKSIEQFEYETTKRHCSLTAGCIEQGTWSFIPKAISSKGCLVKYNGDFNSRWEKIKDQPHTQAYIHHYNEHYAICDLNPEKHK